MLDNMGDMVLLVAAAVVFLLGLYAFCRRPGRTFLLLAANCALGAIALFVINILQPLTGLSLPLNVGSCIASTALGIPGVLTMAAMKIFIGI